MELLSRALMLMASQKNSKCHPRCKKVGLAQLSFADDLILFSKTFYEPLVLIHNELNHFSATSGLSIDQEKCTVFFWWCKGRKAKIIGCCYRMSSWSMANSISWNSTLSSKKLAVCYYRPLILFCKLEPDSIAFCCCAG